MVDQDVGLVAAVRPARDLGAEAPLGLGDVPVDRGAHARPRRSVATSSPSRATPSSHGGDHRGEVAGEARQAVVAHEQREHVVARRCAAVHELQHRDDQALGLELAHVHREAARVLAAGVALVRLERLDQDDLAVLVVDRRVDVVVGQVAAAVPPGRCRRRRRPGPSRRARAARARSAPTAAR